MHSFFVGGVFSSFMRSIIKIIQKRINVCVVNYSTL